MLPCTFVPVDWAGVVYRGCGRSSTGHQCTYDRRPKQHRPDLPHGSAMAHVSAVWSCAQEVADRLTAAFTPPSSRAVDIFATAQARLFCTWMKLASPRCRKPAVCVLLQACCAASRAAYSGCARSQGVPCRINTMLSHERAASPHPSHVRKRSCGL